MARSPSLPPALFSQKWFAHLEYGKKTIVSTAVRFRQALGKPAITDISDYTLLYNFFQENFSFSEPAREAVLFIPRHDATDPFLAVNNRWNDDDVFAQAALSGINPLQVERVTENEAVGANWQEIQSSLNPSVDWDEAVQQALPNNNVTQVCMERESQLFWTFRDRGILLD